MKVIKGRYTLFCDVDDTLVLYRAPEDYPGTKVTIKFENNLYGGFSSESTLAVNEAAIEALKDHKRKGAIIVVWSQGGWDWAESVVKALKIDKLVDYVVEKPSVVFDDLSMGVWSPRRQLPLPKGWEERLEGLVYIGEDGDV